MSDGGSSFETCTSSCQAGLVGGGAGQLDSPSGVATDGSGNVYVGDVFNNRIDEFSSGGGGGGGGLGAPTDLQVFPRNGDVAVSWQPPASGANLVTGYKITATPVYNDRRPRPSAGGRSVQVGPNQLTADPGGGGSNGPPLVVDCHQLYTISVSALQGTTVGQAAVSNGVRPSGNVAQGEDPPYVVILVDGIDSIEPGFIENPEQPTADNQPSYCPESVRSSGTEAEADFLHAGNGPWSFFHKWNVGEIDPNGNPTGSNTGDNTRPNTESLPKARERGPGLGNPFGIRGGKETHSFMLDAIAAQGAIVLPFSYHGFDLGSAQRFTFDEYNECDSDPTDLVCFNHPPTLQQDASLLGSEVVAASHVWPTSKIVILAHSQGGLVSFTWWLCSHSKLTGVLKKEYCVGPGQGGHRITTFMPPRFVGGFSMDSPITGACGQLFGHCVGPSSYPRYSTHEATAPAALALDISGGLHQAFHFIGTFGDSPGKAPTPFGTNIIPGYQLGAQTLDHQLLFNYDAFPGGTVDFECADSLDESSCPITQPFDHISECPVSNDPDRDLDMVGYDHLDSDRDGGSGGDDGGSPVAPWETAHFVEKYCPGNVSYFNSQLGLSY